MEESIGTRVIKMESTGTKSSPGDLALLNPISQQVAIKIEDSTLLKCPICNMLFPTTESLETHKATHANKCKFCELQFKNRDKINEHFLHEHTEVDSGHLYCTICKEEFESEQSLEQHIPKQHTQIYKHQCQHCEKTFQDSRDFEVHKNIHLGLLKNQCSVCSKSFPDARRLKAHLVSHNDVKFECGYCDKSYSRKIKLTHHMKVHTNPSAYECVVCKKMLSSKCSLTEHMKLHNSFKCKICDESFKKRLDFQYHTLRHKGISSYKCVFCDGSFAAMYELRKHMSIHKDNNKYVCHICEKIYTSSKSLKCHIRRHTGIRNYPCKLCDSKFFSSTELNSHIMFMHTRDSSYQCPICTKKLSTASNLKLHMAAHAGIRKHQCHQCEKSFIGKATLVEHIQGVHSGTRVACNKCDMTFKYPRSLRKHTKKKHSDNSLNPVELPENDSKHVLFSVVLDTEDRNKGKTGVSEVIQPKSKSKTGSVKNLAKTKTAKKGSVIKKVSESKTTDSIVKKAMKNCGKFGKVKLRLKPNKQLKNQIGKGKKAKVESQRKKKTSVDELKCHLCKQRFTDMASLGVHLKCHGREPNYRCELCNKRFKCQSTLNSHLNNHPLTELFDCPFCDMVFDSPQQLCTHTAKHTNSILERSAELRSGDVPELEGSTSPELEGSSGTPPDDSAEVCANTQQSSSNAILQSGISDNSVSDIFNTTGKSKTDSRQFDDVQSETDSRQFDDEPQGYNLTEIAKLYSDPVDLQPTGMIVTNEVYKLSTTPKETVGGLTTNVSKIRNEDKKQTSNKCPLQCDICQRYFTSSGWLSRHMKSHSQQTGNTTSHSAVKRKISATNSTDTNTKLPKLYKTKSKVSVTINTPIKVCKDKPFVCEICKKSYVSKKGLKQHSQIHVSNHIGEKPSRVDKISEKPHEGGKTSQKPPGGDELSEKPPAVSYISVKCEPLESVQCSNDTDQYSSLNKSKKHSNISENSTKLEVRSFTCQICAKSYATKQGLKRHQAKIHLVDKSSPNPLKSSGDIDNNGPKTSAMQDHLVTDKAFRCKICERYCTDEHELKQHTKSHVYIKTSTKVVIV